MIGSLLYGLGYLLAALALRWNMLVLLWLGFGVIGGIGLGLGYVTPVATVAKWFPDKKGLVTGMVVMGFGFGALLMSKVIAPGLDAAFHGQLPLVFAGTGLIVGGVGLIAAVSLRNPPSPEPSAELGSVVVQRVPPELCSGQFLLMWLVFFCNIAAGIAIIGFQSPLMQDLWREANPALPPATLAAYGATLIAASSVFHGLGRLFWGGISDQIGQLRTFRIILATQVVAFAALILVRNPWLFGIPDLLCAALLRRGFRSDAVLRTEHIWQPADASDVRLSFDGVVRRRGGWPAGDRSPERSLRRPGSGLCFWPGGRLAGAGILFVLAAAPPGKGATVD